MELTHDSKPCHIYTGGKAFDRTAPVVVLIHGAGHDHSVWNHQARSLAHHGFAVLAPDLPGHGRSAGAPLPTIETLADWIADLLDTAGVPHASIAGHSMGSLIALETAARHPERVDRLLLLGSVAPMPVAPPLLEAARNHRDSAHAMINQWSYAPSSQLGASPVPGTSLMTMNLRLMERQRDGILANDLAACNAYLGGLDAAHRVRARTLLICGEKDQMTPRKALRPLQDALVHTPGGPHMVIIQGAGHAMMAEAPDAVSNAMRAFLRT